MFAAALVVFREVLEAALIVGIIMSATRGVPHRGRYISLGILGGTIGAILVAVFTNSIAGLFEGIGQEIVNATILFIAVGLIGWHVVWMNKHGREIAAHMKQVGQNVAKGTDPMSILAMVVGLAVLREGSEIVLILQGLWTNDSAHAMILGSTLGFVGGALAGSAIYLGFLALPIGRVFSLTNFVLMMIAAGMAARGANFLAQADLIPTFSNRLWDTSAILSEQSIAGQFMAALTGYIATPNGIELIAYALTICTIIMLTALSSKGHLLNRRNTIAACIVIAMTFCVVSRAHALEVLDPHVEEGEKEFEQQGYLGHDHTPDLSNKQGMTFSAAYTPNSWWHPEFELEFDRNPGSDQQLRFNSFNWENTFQLAEAGEYWIDPAFFYEMDMGRSNNVPNQIIMGFLGSKVIGPFEDTINLLVHKDWGIESTPAGFIYSNQLKYRLMQQLEPGFELYGDTDGKAAMYNQQLAIGPAIFGKFMTFEAQAIRYQLGVVFGATPATPNAALRWKLEYEF